MIANPHRDVTASYHTKWSRHTINVCRWNALRHVAMTTSDSDLDDVDVSECFVYS